MVMRALLEDGGGEGADTRPERRERYERCAPFATRTLIIDRCSQVVLGAVDTASTRWVTSGAAT